MQRIAGDAAQCRSLAHVQEVMDFEIDADAHRRPRKLFHEVRRSGGYVENRDRIVLGHFPKQTTIDAVSAVETIETAEIAQPALHGFARRIMFIAELGSVDALRGEQSD